MVSVGVVGAGSWGTALATVLADNGYGVNLWARRNEQVEEMNRHHTNSVYLPNHVLPDSIEAFSSLHSTLFRKEFVFIVVPSHCMREVLQASKQHLDTGVILVSASKGFEPASTNRMSEIIKEELPQQEYAILSGPSHAEEVVKKCPTTVVVASSSKDTGAKVQKILSNPYFRVYTSTDVIGVELAGALKNVIAIAAGIVDGLRLGDNTKAALITRGVAEIFRLGKRMGARSETFLGLAGIGDLVVTCMSQHSRNWKAGYALSQGKPLQVVLEEVGMVVEGVQTTRVARDLSLEYDVTMPLTEEIFRVLFEGKWPKDAVYDLMRRESTDEFKI